METNSILTANILDILFEGRNKEYGAYELRNTYNKRIGIAISMTALVVMVFTGAVIWKKADASSSIVDPVVVFTPENHEPVDEIIPPKKIIKSEPLKSIRNTPPVIVLDTEVKEPPVPNDQLTQARIDTRTVYGKDEIGIIPPEEIKGGSLALELPKKLTSEEPTFTIVEIEARFNGNWNNYLQKEIEKNIDELTEAGLSGTCMIRFIVSKDGTVSNVEAMTMKGTKLAEVAVNAIRKGPKWIPAIQNGVPVNAYRQQPVTFKITD